MLGLLIGIAGALALRNGAAGIAPWFLFLVGVCAWWVVVRKSPRGHSWWSKGVGVAASWTILQCVPLPTVFVSWVSPGRFELAQDTAKTLGESLPFWTTLSWDPAATAWNAVGLWGLYLLSIVAGVIAGDRRRFLFYWMLGALIGCLTAIVSLHHLLGVERFLGWWDFGGRFASPIVNDNQLSGISGVGVILCLGGFFYTQKRAWFAALTFSCAVLCVLAGSRGGVVSTAVFTLIFLWGHWHLRSKKSVSLERWIALGLICAAACIMVFSIGGEELSREFSASSAGLSEDAKIQKWSRAAGLVSDYWISGVGRGGFEGAYSRHSGLSNHSVGFVENSVLQGVLDWGLLGFAFTLGVGVALILIVRSGIREKEALPAACVVLLLASQSLFDFGFSMGGTLSVFVLLTGTFFRGGEKERITKGWIPVVTVLVLVLGWGKRPAHLESIPTNRAAAEEHVRKHPGDYLGWGRLSMLAREERDTNTVRYLNRALHLHPRNAGLRRYAGSLLASEGHLRQAGQQFRWALTKSTLVPTTILLMDNGGLSARDFAAATPEDPEVVTAVIRELRKRGRKSAAFAVGKRHFSLLEDNQMARLLELGNELQLFREVLELSAKVERPHITTARAARSEMALGELDRAQTRLEQWDQENAEKYLLLADISLKQSAGQKALKYSLKALSKAASRREIAWSHLRLSKAYSLLGMETEAARSIDNYLKILEK